MAFQDCISEVEAAVGRKLTDKEQESLAKDVDTLIKRFSGDENIQARVLEGIEQGMEQARIDNIIAQRNAMFNRRAKLYAVDYVMTRWKTDPKAGIQAMLTGKPQNIEGANRSVAAAMQSRANVYLAGLYTELEKNGVMKMFRSGEIDEDIYIATSRIHRKETDFSDLAEEAVTAARIIDKHTDAARIQMNKAGAMVGRLEGWTTSRNHDGRKISADREGWLDFMMERMDWDKTFTDVAPNERRDMLLVERTKLESGEHVTFTGPESTNRGFEGFGNIGKRASQKRVFHFKTPEDEFAYSKRFGRGSLTQNVFFHMERVAADTAIMEHFGPNAEANLNDIFDEVIDKLTRDTTLDPAVSVKQIQDVAHYRNYVKESLWPNISGSSHAISPGRHTYAAWSQGIRAVQSSSGLGMAVLSMPSDIAFHAAEMTRQGENFLSGVTKAFDSLLEGKTSFEKQELMSSSGVFADSLKGSLSVRFDSADYAPGKVAAMMQLFFKYTGIQWWPDRLRDGFVHSMMHRFALHSDNGWGGLSDDMRTVLKQGGFDSGKWDIIRQATRIDDADVDRRAFVVPEEIDNLPDSVFEAYLTAGGNRVSKPRIESLRHEIKTDLQTMFYDRARKAVVEGDIESRAMLLGGEQGGTWMRMMREQIALFKTFPVGVFKHAIAPEIFRHGETTSWSEALKNGNAMVGLARMIGTATLLGYTSMVAKDLAKGRNPRDPFDHKTILAAMAQGGGLGLYGDFLFGEVKNRFGGGFVTSLMGPTAQDISSLADLYGRMREGDDMAAQSFRFLLNNTPGINIFYTRAALDYLILYQIQEALNPGSLKRMESRLKREQDQTFISPPSQAIPTGGGNRLFEGVR